MKTINALQKSARTAGIGLVFMFVFGILADSIIMPKIVVWQDALQTTKNLLNNQQIFRTGIFCYASDMLANIVVAIALALFLKPVNRPIALLSAGFRLVYVTVRSFALSNLIQVSDLLKSSFSDPYKMSNKIMHFLEADKAGYTYALLVFGFHIFLIGYLIVRSGYMSKIFGILLWIAFAGYMVYGTAFLFDPDFSQHENLYKMILGIPGVVAELSLCMGLLIKKYTIETQ